MKKLPLFVEKIILFLFILSIFSTFFFWWSGLSEKNAYDTETERKFAEILNENFRNGDIVFTEKDWDLDFLKHLNAGIFPIFLDLKNATERSVATAKNSDDRIFLLLNSEDSREKFIKKLNLKEIESFKAGTGVVLLADTLYKTVKKSIVFSRDIGKAKRVSFFDGEKREECRKVSEKRWQCSNESWNYVGMTSVLFNKNSKQAVWAHPVSGKTLEIVFDLPPNSKKLYFNSVFAESAYRSSNHAPVDVEIMADENTLLKYSNPHTSTSIEKNAKLPENTKEITIKLTTSDDRQRHFAFNGFITDEL